MSFPLARAFLCGLDADEKSTLCRRLANNPANERQAELALANGDVWLKTATEHWALTFDTNKERVALGIPSMWAP